MSDITFDIEVTDITSTSANVRVTPSRDDVPYFFDVVSEYILTEFYNGDAAAVVEDMFDSLLESGMPVEEVSEYTKWGEISYFYDGGLSPDEEYVVYTFPINEQGDVIAEGATYNFRTLAEEQADASAKTALGSMKKAVKRTSRREVKSMPQVDHNNAGQKLSLKMAAMMK